MADQNACALVSTTNPLDPTTGPPNERNLANSSEQTSKTSERGFTAAIDRPRRRSDVYTADFAVVAGNQPRARRNTAQQSNAGPSQPGSGMTKAGRGTNNTPGDRARQGAATDNNDSGQLEVHDDTIEPKTQPTPIPDYFLLPRTHPAPFSGTLEASLDAILEFNKKVRGTQKILIVMMKPPRFDTNWPVLLGEVRTTYGDGIAHAFFQELLFLVLRTLFPEQIIENRRLMLDMFTTRGNMASHMVLRYDMLRTWKMSRKSAEQWKTLVFRPDVIPQAPLQPSGPPEPPPNPTHPDRRPLMLNIWPTILMPLVGNPTRNLLGQMKHHCTQLDDMLLLTDEEVAGWPVTGLLVRLSMVLLEWQALVRNNEMMSDLQANNWEEMVPAAAENPYIGDNRPAECLSKKEKEERGQLGSATRRER